MTDTPGGGGDPPGPAGDTPLPPAEGEVPQAYRESRRRPLIPRKYRGFIPLAIILLVMAVLIVGPILFQGETGDTELSPVPTPSGTAIPTGRPVTVTQPTAEIPPVTVTPTSSGPPDFTLTTSPTDVSAGRGEIVIYTMVIDGKNGFASPVSLELTATALFVTRRYDFGTYHPPFPQTIRYPFVVPDYLPSGVTVDGTLRATSGDLVHDNRLRLEVE